MIEKEVAELRRQLRPDHDAIEKVCGCYVTGGRTIVSTFEQSMALAEREEYEAWLGLLKKSLSGTLGKNLLDLPFSNEEVMHGKAHALLMRLRESRLTDAEALQSFYEKVISSVTMEDNYLILIAHNSYDIPFRGRDGAGLDDASDEMYSHLICSICPVKLSKPGLGYDGTQRTFCTMHGSWLVSPPQLGFLFPAFDDRSTNLYNALYYTKNTDDAQEAFIQTIFHVDAPLSAGEQKHSFETVLSDSLEEECSMEVVQAVHEQLSGLIEAHKESKVPEPLLIHRSTVEEVLEDCGVSEQHLSAFSEQFDKTFGEDTLVSPRNLIDSKRFDVKTNSVTIHVKPEGRDLVQTRVIDGVKYILIRAEDSVEVSGVSIQVEPEHKPDAAEPGKAPAAN